MSLKYGILGLLNYKSMTGYELNKFFEESLAFFWSAQTSQIYRTLAQLEKEECVTQELVVQYDKPNKKVYSITEKGLCEFREWLKERDNNAANLKNSFLMKIFFSAIQGREATIKALEDFCEDMEAERNALNDIDTDFTNSPVAKENAMYWGLTIDLGKRYYDMCISWAEESISVIKGE